MSILTATGPAGLYDRAWVTPNHGSRWLHGRTTLTMGTLDLRVQFYPEGGFFLTGGLGLGYMWLSDSGNGPDIGINVAGVHTPDPHARVGQIGVGLTLH